MERSAELHCVLLLDESLPGSELVEQNVNRIAEAMARLLMQLVLTS